MYRPLIVAAVAAIVAGPAHAHVSFENAQAAVGTTYKAVLRIPHGCDGKATDEVRVRIPEGVIAVKPMPKAGWTIEKTVTGYKAEYDLHGKKVAKALPSYPGAAEAWRTTSTMMSSSSGRLSTQASRRAKRSISR